ncbi:MAG: FAD-dependent oxidoreductase [Actinomycetota bacterium]|nr:FAD-dependent oxidoreductase [Actinomycetota bacterium]
MFAAQGEAERRGITLDELLSAAVAERGLEDKDRAERANAQTRRQLLAKSAGLAAGTALALTPPRSVARLLASGPRIAIVGAGLAGVRCAHLLWTAHPHKRIAATVYEGNHSRAGGRCWTLRDFFSAGLITEHGGAFIDTTHIAIRRLVAQLDLDLEVVNGGDLPIGQDIYFVDGAYYSQAEASAEWSVVGYPAFRHATHQSGSPAGARRLDSMSVPEWLESTEIGVSSRLGKLLLASTVTENGGDPATQSALDLIQVTAGSPRSMLELLPGDDERYHVIGGNDRIIKRMITHLPGGTVRLDHQLVALRQNSNRTITLVFKTSGRTVEVVADQVVLALPFSTLRNVDLSASGLSAAKRRVIRTLGMGTNAKIHVELSRKTWPALGFAGAAYSEWDGFCCAWDDSVPLGPSASPALLLGFPGGRVGAHRLTGPAHGPAPARDLAWFLREIEPVFPGTSRAATGRVYEDHWSLDPWVHGAYSYFRVGQANTYGAIAAAPEGRFHFAGEHTSINYSGFLNGAVESGERAARALFRSI